MVPYTLCLKWINSFLICSSLAVSEPCGMDGLYGWLGCYSLIVLLVLDETDSPVGSQTDRAADKLIDTQIDMINEWNVCLCV